MPAPDASLGEALAALAEVDPDRPAITHEGVTRTRRELELRTNRLARRYAELGVGQDDFVTIGLPNGIEHYEATIATWKLGATPQPISARLPAIERDAIVELAAPRLVVGVEPGAGYAGPVLPAGYDPGDVSDAPLPPAVAASLKAPTSGGSTGRPKLIVSTQPARLDSLAPFAGLLRMPPDSVHLATGPLYHNGPFLMSHCALFTGAHVVLMSRFDARRALELVEEHRVSWMYAVPTMMQRIWRLPEEERLAHDLSSLQVLMHLAAPCPAWLKEAWIDWLGPEKVVELYAATEVQAATVIDGAEWLAHRGSVGRAVVGELQILDEHGDPVPPGTVGEVWMRRGPGQAGPYRYIGAEPRGRGDGWESVGDLGHLDGEGYLYLADRASDMILVGGANVYPAEVEAAIEAHPSVASACVIGLPDDDLGNVPHALVQPHGADLDLDDLRAWLVDRLASYKLPRTYELVAEPLRDDAGKVRRSALRAERLPGGAASSG